MSGAPGTTGRPRRLPSLAAVVVLTLTWMLLWERISLFIVLTGVLLSLLVSLVFPLPRIERPGRVRLRALAQLIGRLALDIVLSSVRVVRLVCTPGTPRSAIIRVQLRSRSDLVLTLTAEQVSLVPGTIVVEVHRASSTIYLHVLGEVEPAALEQAARDVLAAEQRALRTLGMEKKEEVVGR